MIFTSKFKLHFKRSLSEGRGREESIEKCRWSSVKFVKKKKRWLFSYAMCLHFIEKDWVHTLHEQYYLCLWLCLAFRSMDSVTMNTESEGPQSILMVSALGMTQHRHKCTGKRQREICWFRMKTVMLVKLFWNVLVPLQYSSYWFGT